MVPAGNEQVTCEPVGPAMQRGMLGITPINMSKESNGRRAEKIVFDLKGVPQGQHVGPDDDRDHVVETNIDGGQGEWISGGYGPPAARQ